MQTIYIGHTKKVGDIDLKNYRVYTERPTKIIEELKKRGVKLADHLFIDVEKFSEGIDARYDLASPTAQANKQLSAI